MSNAEDETQTGIPDEQLPDDLVPGEDNPLAEGLDDRESAGDLLAEGKDDEGADPSDDEARDASDTSEEGNTDDSDA